MAIKSVRRKSNRRSSSWNHTDLRESTMVPYATSCLSSPRMIPLLVSAVLFVCVLILSNRWPNMGGSVGLDSTVGYGIYSAKVVNEFPHDPNAFTQGLLYAGNDSLFESTGLNGHSSVRRVAIGSGKVLSIHKMPDSYFGEGLTLLGDRIRLLPILRAFHIMSVNVGVVDFDEFLFQWAQNIMTFKHHMKDGWGLATDGKVLFGSDGSSTLYEMDPQTFKVVKKHIIMFKGHEVYNLNELEYVNGEIWANVWQTDCIARISGKGGIFLGWIYLPDLRKQLIESGHTDIDVLNGIAWDQDKDRLFVTGKLWPKLYEIKVQPMKKPYGVDIERLCMRPPVHFGKT
ncbi:glutamine cyclotransferase family protein [Striga asiatica]|uniref:Glutamine cyclotransferase family protein n=1 Tax=Striga asiatica TaxID=4170 RepID=A0A5A7R147_STRAF|nr:glutamine cyclotransferase family protein [Striga asiatica]